MNYMKHILLSLVVVLPLGNAFGTCRNGRCSRKAVKVIKVQTIQPNKGARGAAIVKFAQSRNLRRGNAFAGNNVHTHTAGVNKNTGCKNGVCNFVGRAQNNAQLVAMAKAVLVNQRCKGKACARPAKGAKPAVKGGKPTCKGGVCARPTKGEKPAAKGKGDKPAVKGGKPAVAKPVPMTVKPAPRAGNAGRNPRTIARPVPAPVVEEDDNASEVDEEEAAPEEQEVARRQYDRVPAEASSFFGRLGQWF